jgi:hypothetical protein
MGKPKDSGDVPGLQLLDFPSVSKGSAKGGGGDKLSPPLKESAKEELRRRSFFRESDRLG